jgi:Zn-dependent M32 family carboxypeptidase
MDDFTDEKVADIFRQLPSQTKLDLANEVLKSEQRWREERATEDHDLRVAHYREMLAMRPLHMELMKREVDALEKLVAHFCK